MSNYFDFVLCKMGNRKNVLFHAPAFSKLAKGDLVKVEAFHGEKMARVISCITLSADDEPKIDFIMNATGASKDVKKVLAKVEYNDFEYEDDMENHNEKSRIDSET